MIAVIYQMYVKEGREEEFRQVWNTVALYFMEYRGALGSCLHRTSEGLWVAYSRWPDLATRDASWPKEQAPSCELPQDIRESILRMKDCIDQERKIPEICLEVVEDLLLEKNCPPLS